ncbi:autotransporter outer membrane beta-barrel domain-containing protein [Pseudohongiella sp. O18]|uniref:autotransporter outer membrane beta-barrel domain-containing protein n=1 Tax=Pseudohongiella sp. O18 TaxID=2904248 RepID=UPI001F290AFB|nr:autotransporter outer membrane beta-barrel domain-containing protein [Pseudohongiella sp. O18]
MSVTFRSLILLSTVGTITAHAGDLPPVTTDASTFGTPQDRSNLNVNLNGISVPPYQIKSETLDIQTMTVGKDGDQGASGTWYQFLGGQPFVLIQAQGHSTAIPGDVDALANGTAGSGPATSLTNYNNLASWLDSGVPVNAMNNPGLVAASIGGNRGGAPGGLAGDVTITNKGRLFTSTSNSMGILAHSIGGSASGGQNGGNAGAVRVNNDGSITTGGEFTSPTQFQIFKTPHSPGIVARSIGAFGGSGGSECGFLCFYGYGTNGGNGGNAGQVNVTNTGTIMTASEASQGILAISIGGGGGNAGPGDGLIASVGGGGGEGGQGSLAYARNLGQIVAQASRGIQVQSISGGGGDGGHASGVVMSLGGSGGDAESSGSATIDNCIDSFAQTLCSGWQQGQISSFGSALFAQSVAGGGGAGGSTKGISAVGGSGASGANAGKVSVYNAGTLLSTGAHHSTIHAQSVGGGGGHGGAAVTGGLNASVAIGGSGGSGGTGDDVGVYNIGNISAGSSTDLANFSHGIFAQSVGGGGGSAGSATSGSIGLGAAIALSIGGQGGAGASAGAVTVNNCGFTDSGACTSGAGGGTIQTFGSHSSGIHAQSVGGGGGAGGLAASGAMSNGAAIAASLGGSGGQGGAGGQVTVNSQSQFSTLDEAVSGAADITTGGVFSSGIFAQSVGGGGGSAGTAITATAGSVTLSAAGGSGPFFKIGGRSNDGGLGNDGGTVNVNSSSLINTTGNHATAIVAQSVGGGGGHGGSDFSGSASLNGSLSLGLGGAGGPGGIGGQVNLTTSALSGNSTAGTFASSGRYAIQTTGHHADGILAQSVGGGGGTGGTSIDGTLSARIAASLSLGGSGGQGGVSDKVSLTNNLSVLTSGDHSKGLVAQSIGGGGGNAGASMSASVGGTGAFSAAGLTMGNAGGIPAGGNGSFGNAVSLTNNAQVTTQGDSFASAVVAQSIGGGGGHGGVSGALSLATKAAISAAIGGNGGTGNTAGAVTLTQNGGSVLTSGSHSHGLLAQSIGGGGGAGGFTLAGSGGAQGVGISATIGGNGGTGGNGSSVTVNTTSSSNGGGGQPTSIKVTGEHSNAILAQSIGGGGGNGAVSVSVSLASKLAFAQADVPSLNLGNKAGSGGTGGDVAVHTQASLSSSDSAALVAQSIGGGGGLGGTKVTGDFTFDPTRGEADLSLGASGVNGATGAEAGNVLVDAGTGASKQGDISSSGNHAPGILAQSVGGGGGAGGWSFAARFKGGGEEPGVAPASAIAMGGKGGIGGNSGQVVVNDVGNVSTSGINAQGVVAQSIGGGGGHGGLAISASGALGGSKVGVGGIGFAMGGSGGSGANSGAVQVTTATGSQISTSGHSAGGILAQSIGGGGGQGGGALSIAAAINANSFSIAHGGSGGSGGAPQTAQINDITVGVSVTNNGQITTGGTAKSDDASAIQAQSVGGGGGSAGFTVSLEGSGGVEPLDNIGASISLGASGGNGNSGNLVYVSSTGSLTTTGDRSSGILAQSVGAGGGHAGFTFSADAKLDLPQHSLGGTNGSNGNGGLVRVQNTGNVTTTGAQAHGIVAQSVGAGGGHSGLSVSGTLSTSADLFMNLGGAGNATGQGGEIDLQSSGTFNLNGAHSVGLLAQSIGGGGGVAGVSLGKLNLTATPRLNMTAGGMQGIGGKVTVSNASSGILRMTSTGSDSPGILAQSIAGGGGYNFFSAGSNTSNAALDGTVQLGATSAGAAVSGTVSVTDGTINTQGARSAAIIAQSITGGGGVINVASKGAFGVSSILGMLGGSALSTAGDVTVTSLSQLTTQGDDSQAIVAQSISGGGGVLNADSVASLRLGAAGAQGTGNAGAVTVKTTGPSLTTNGQRASVLVAQSIGGGGGLLSAGGSVSGGLDSSKIGLGGGTSSALTSSGGAVSVNNSATVTASGARAHGLVAQSIGGGGGMVSANEIVSGNTLTPFASANAQGSGNGGVVNLTNTGAISLSDSAAIGIVAQSIGGGGGLFDDGRIGTSGPQMDIAWGGGSASNVSGNGGNVTVTNSASIKAGVGILAQSAGGGGGAIVSSVYGAVAGGYGKGSAGSVSVTNQGTINATSIGISAAAMSGDQPQTQSLTVATNGSITAGNYGIMAQVAGTAPATASQNLTVNVGQAGLTSQPVIKANTSVLMQTQGAGVLNNYGTIGDGIHDYGAVFNNGSHTFNNYGTYIGAFGGNGRLTVNNQAGGILNIGQYFINNQGTVPAPATVPGDLNNLGGTVYPTPGRPAMLHVNGAFTQSSTGTLKIDFDPKVWYETKNYPFDQINLFGGGQLSLKGNLDFNVMNPRYLGGTGSLFVRLDNGEVLGWEEGTQPDIDLNINFRSLVLTFKGELDTRNRVYNVTYNTDFNVPGLDDDTAAVGKHINELLIKNRFNSSDDDAVLMDVITQTDSYGIYQLYSDMIPSGQSNSLSAALGYTADQMNSSMYHMQYVLQNGYDYDDSEMSDNGAYFNPANPRILIAYQGDDITSVVGNMPVRDSRKASVWFAPVRMDVSKQDKHGVSNTKHTGGTIGFDYRFSDAWLGGFSLGYAQSQTGYSTQMGHSDIDNLSVSAHTVRQFGDHYVAGALTVVDHDIYHQRQHALGGTPATNYSNSSNLSLGASIEAGTSIRLSTFRVQPYLRLNAYSMKQDEASEVSNSNFALSLKEHTLESYVSELGVHVSGRWNLDNGQLMPSFSLGWRHELSDGETALPTRFNVAGDEEFHYKFAHTPSDHGTASVGLSYNSQRGNTFGLSAFYEEGGRHRASGIEGKVVIRF